jgi:hypothetical protein
MSNYPDENGGPYETPGTGASPYQQGGQTGGYPGGAAPQGEAGRQYETQQFSQPQTSQPHWQGQGQGQGQGQPGYQGYPSQGSFGSGGSSRPSMNVRRTFKATEFWVMVVVGIALLIAAAVTDSGPDNQGFSAEDAWRYVTALAVAYILSRGLTKLGGHERDDHDRRGR